MDTAISRGLFITPKRSLRPPPRLEISFLEAHVYRHGQRVPIAGQDLKLLFAIAQRPRSSPAEELAEQLWPARDWHDARNSLKVQLHRLRRRLADDGAIVRDTDGLRLCPEARVDLWEIDRCMSALRAGEIDDDAERDVLFGVYRRLRRPRPTCLTSWEWFEPVSRRLSDMASDLARRLATDAIKNGRTGTALQLAAEMLADDECDEVAREIAILAHLARGDRAAALRQYRTYRDVLATELACEPSRSLFVLVEASR